MWTTTNRLATALALCLLTTQHATAQDIDEDDLLRSPVRDEIDDFDADAEELAFEAPAIPAKPTFPPPVALQLDPRGKTPLTAAFPPLAVAGTTGALVIELPVLVAHDPRQLTERFTLQADILVDGKPSATLTSVVDPAQHRAGQPVYVFFKTLVTMPRPEATILVGVQQTVADGTSKKLFMAPVPRTW